MLNISRSTSWTTKTLGDVSLLITDGTHISPSYVESGVPMLDSKHIGDGFVIDDSIPEKYISREDDICLSKRCKPSAGDILISSRGSIGKIAIVREGQDFNIMGNMILIRLPENVNRKFAAYYLQSKVRHIESISQGVAQKGLYLNQVRNYLIPLPHLPEQIRIAAILDQADALRVKRREALAQLENLTQSIFIEMFGDPVANPKGWDVSPINDLPLHISDGNYSSKYPTSSEFVSEGVPFIRANNLHGLTLNSDDLRFITPDKHRELAKGHICERDVLLVSRGDVGKVGLVPPQFHDANINAQLVLIRPTSKQIEPEYLCHLFNNSRMAAYVKNFETGVALKQLPIGNLKKVCLPIPPPDLQTAFSNIVRSAEKQSAMQIESLQGLDAMFASLQHRAFRGEL